MIETRALKKRKPEAVERWFLEHADGIYTFIFYRAGRDPELAADVVQETFLTALRKMDDYDPERGTMRTWLTFIAKNCVRTALRREGRYETSTAFWENLDRKLLSTYRSLATTPLPDEVLESEETVEMVQLTLSSIPGNYRKALLDHYQQKKSLKEIARLEGTTEGAVKTTSPTWQISLPVLIPMRQRSV